MKKLILAVAFLSVLAASLAAGAASIEHRRLGLGLNIGEPLGFNGRFYFWKWLSLDATLGYGFGEKALIVQPSVLLNLTDILDYNGDNFSVVPYFGAGFKTGIVLSGPNDGAAVAAVRFPLGATMLLKDGVLEVSLEFAPGVQFAPGGTGFDPTGGVGIRYYFF